MATLFEINEEIRSCVDLETGEILDEEKLRSLQIDKHEKRRNYGLFILNLRSDIEAYREQERRFRAKREKAEKTVEWLKSTLEADLAGAKMKEPEFSIYYTNTQAVEITNPDALPAKFLEYKDPMPKKNDIKKAIKAGEIVPGAKLIENKNMIVK